MQQTLAMPKLGLTMTEGQVAEWRRAPGESFAAGDVLLVIETDKIANDLEAPAAGRLTEVLVEPGRTVPVGAPLARWQPVDRAWAATAETEAAAGACGPPSAPAPCLEEKPVAAPPAAAAPALAGQRIVATPYARRLAGERGVALPGLTGSGPGGRIRAADVPLTAAAPRPATAPLAQAAEHFLLADVPAAALLDWRAGLPPGQGGLGSLVFYLAARVLMAMRPQALCAAGDCAPVPAAVAAQGLIACLAALRTAPADGPAAQLRFASAGRGPLRLLAPARLAGCELSLGLGSLGGDGFTLALRADAASWSAADAGAYLTQLHGAIEDPRRLLL